jgi:hypothetical protein
MGLNDYMEASCGGSRVCFGHLNTACLTALPCSCSTTEDVEISKQITKRMLVSSISNSLVEIDFNDIVS